jgi:ABC-type dipeptide/oligopeptide/nickel transport system permease component
LLKYIIRRLLILPVVMFLVSVILFLLVLQLPVEMRVAIYVPAVNPHLTPQQYQDLLDEIIERRGLNDSLPVQYVSWLETMVKGGWGWSPTWRQTVLEGLKQRAPATLELTLYAMVPAVVFALILGSVSAQLKDRLPDHLVRGAAFVAWAFPPFILALILMNVFYAWLGWFPPERASVWAGPIINSAQFRSYTGLLTLDALLNARPDIFWDALRHLALPAATLALTEWALLTRIMRSSLLETLRQDYVTTARAKGVPEKRVINLHARRNALLPVVSTGGVMTSMLITGVVVIEVIFNFNGVGRWAVKGILSTDIPVAVGFAIFSCSVVVLASLVSDILYALLDPRIRLFEG